MKNLTFAAVWTELTIEERETLAELANVSLPVLALTNIRKFYRRVPEQSKFSKGGCDCPGCAVLHSLKLKVRRYNRRRTCGN